MEGEKKKRNAQLKARNARLFAERENARNIPDESKAAQIERQIVVNNMWLVDKMVRSLIPSLTGTRSMDADDVRQAALEALCVAVKKFNPEKGTSLSTYAHRCMRPFVIRRAEPWIHQSQAASEQLGVLRALRDYYLTTKGRPITEEELRHEMLTLCPKLSAKKLESLLA